MYILGSMELLISKLKYFVLAALVMFVAGGANAASSYTNTQASGSIRYNTEINVGTEVAGGGDAQARVTPGQQRPKSRPAFIPSGGGSNYFGKNNNIITPDDVRRMNADLFDLPY
jgi:hypothetical protein